MLAELEVVGLSTFLLRNLKCFTIHQAMHIALAHQLIMIVVGTQYIRHPAAEQDANNIAFPHDSWSHADLFHQGREYFTLPCEGQLAHIRTWIVTFTKAAECVVECKLT